MSLSQRLNKRVALQTATDGQDANGQQILEFTTVTEVWAEVKDVAGRLFIGADQVERSTTTEVLIRHRAGLPANLYVLHRGDRYQVQGEPLGQDNRTLKLVCLKVKP